MKPPRLTRRLGFIWAALIAISVLVAPFALPSWADEALDQTETAEASAYLDEPPSDAQSAEDAPDTSEATNIPANLEAPISAESSSEETSESEFTPQDPALDPDASWDILKVKLEKDRYPLGSTISFEGVYSGDTSGAEYNYVWRLGNNWKNWDSTKKATKHYTKETIGSFTPTKPGTYTLSVDIIKDGIKKTANTTIEVYEGYDVSQVIVSDGPYEIGQPISFYGIVEGELVGASYNFVWRLGNNWKNWDSTKKSTGSYTSDSTGTFTPQIPGNYTLSVDVIKGDVKKTTTTTIQVVDGFELLGVTVGGGRPW